MGQSGGLPGEVAIFNEPPGMSGVSTGWDGRLVWAEVLGGSGGHKATSRASFPLLGL